MRTIEFFRFKTGKSPVEEFLDTLNNKQVQKVLWVLKVVAELERVPETYLKKLKNTDDIWEIRVQVSSNIFRLLGFFRKGNLVILTNGFQKKQQKTPKEEIAIAESRKQEYENRRLQ